MCISLQGEKMLFAWIVPAAIRLVVHVTAGEVLFFSLHSNYYFKETLSWGFFPASVWWASRHLIRESKM